MSQNESDMNKPLHNAEDSSLETSFRQRALTRLESYLCHLNSKKLKSETSIVENHHIDLLIQSRDAGFPDPEALMEQVLPPKLRVYS